MLQIFFALEKMAFLQSKLISECKEFSISTGSACSSKNETPSGTHLALGLTKEESLSSLRVSIGIPTKKEEITAFCSKISTVSQS